MNFTKTDVVVAMGSISDKDTMTHSIEILNAFGVTHQVNVISAHRTPKLMYEFSDSINNSEVKVVIAGAGGAAHLPGMLASLCSKPVFGVPIATTELNGMDSLLSIVQMPRGIPVGTLAIGKSGAINAALLAVKMLAQYDKSLKSKLDEYYEQQINLVKEMDQKLS